MDNDIDCVIKTPVLNMERSLKKVVIQARLIRLRDAPIYLGMDKNRFNAEVRPMMVEIPIGNHGVAFDRLDLDAWVEHHKDCNGRLASNNRRRQIWQENVCQGLEKSATFGTLRKKSTVVDFAKVLEQITSKKQKNT